MQLSAFDNTFPSTTAVNVASDGRVGEYFYVTLKDVSVCNDPSGVRGCVDDDGCGGYLEEDVNMLNNFADNHFPLLFLLVTSPIRRP